MCRGGGADREGAGELRGQLRPPHQGLSLFPELPMVSAFCTAPEGAMGDVQAPFPGARVPRLMGRSPLVVLQSRKPLLGRVQADLGSRGAVLAVPLTADLGPAGAPSALRREAMYAEQTPWWPSSSGQTCFSCWVCCRWQSAC